MFSVINTPTLLSLPGRNSSPPKHWAPFGGAIPLSFYIFFSTYSHFLEHIRKWGRWVKWQKEQTCSYAFTHAGVPCLPPAQQFLVSFLAVGGWWLPLLRPAPLPFSSVFWGKEADSLALLSSQMQNCELFLSWGPLTTIYRRAVCTTFSRSHVLEEKPYPRSGLWNGHKPHPWRINLSSEPRAEGESCLQTSARDLWPASCPILASSGGCSPFPGCSHFIDEPKSAWLHIGGSWPWCKWLGSGCMMLIVLIYGLDIAPLLPVNLCIW